MPTTTHKRCKPGSHPYPHPQPPQRSRSRSLLLAFPRAVAAAVALAAILAGLPALLIAAAGWPLPRHLPTLAQVTDLLTAPGMPDRLLINTLACLGWLCWLVLATSAAVEVTAAARHVPAPTLPVLRPGQFVVGALVTALTLSPLLTTTPPTIPPASTPATTAPLTPTPADATSPPGRIDLAGHITLLVGDTTYTYPVRAGDTLWDIAGTWLGDPHRWPEIYHLNAGHPFPHAPGVLTDPDLIYPGWTLTLPHDAHPPAGARPAVPPQAPTAPSPLAAAPTLPPDTPPSTAPGETTVDATQAPRPSQNSAPTATGTTPTPAASPPTPTAEPADVVQHPVRIAGLELPGGWVPLPLAAAIVTAATLAWNRRRRRYRPGSQPPGTRTPGTHPEPDEDDDLAPLPSVVLAARSHLRRNAPDLLQPPADITVREAAQARRAGTPVPPPPPSPTGLQLAGLTPTDQGDPSATPPREGFCLTGPGAPAAARALLVAALTAGTDDEHARTDVVIPAPTLTTLLDDPDDTTGAQATEHLPQLHVTATLDDALARFEADLINRRRHLIDADAATITDYRTNPDHEPLPPALLLTDPPTPDHTDRLAAAARLGADLDATIVVVGDWPHADPVHVTGDGHLDPGSSAPQLLHRADADAARVAVIDSTSLHDILHALRPPPATPPADEPPASVNPPNTEAAPPSPSNDDARPDPEPAGPDPKPAREGSSRVKAHILGSPAILRPDGTPVDSLREAALELLTYLAIHRDGAPLDDIKEALYGEATRQRATQRLATDVANLRNRIRHCLPDRTDTDERADPVINTGGRYHLNPDLLDIDWWNVLHAATRAKTATTPTDQRTAIEEALTHHHGPLADDRDYDWATHPREHTRRLGITLHVRLAELITDTDPARAAQLLETACDLDPYNEDAARLAIQAHVRIGDTETAKTRMRRLRTALDELDETPDETTEALARTLLFSTSTPSNTAAPTRHDPAAQRPRPRPPRPLTGSSDPLSPLSRPSLHETDTERP